MSDISEEKRRNDLMELLRLLAQDQEVAEKKMDMADYYSQLEDIYYDPDSERYFRHYYSDIFATLTQIDSDSESGSIEILARNMQVLKAGYKPTRHDPMNDNELMLASGENGQIVPEETGQYPPGEFGH